MKIYPNSQLFSRSLFFAFILQALVLSAYAQYPDQQSIANNLVHTRPRIVQTDKIRNDVSNNAFSTYVLERQAFELLNSERAAKGLSPLIWNEDVARIARMHSENMARYKFFSHAGLDGSMVDDRADLCGVKRWRAIGENIAYNRGYEKPVEFAVLRWMQSNSHRNNILNSRWKESAVGVAVANDGAFYFTQVFLLRK